MESLFLTTVRIFLWKHWKCFHHSWIKNTFMIIVPIAIAWFQIHVSSGHTNGVQRIFDPIRQVLTHQIKSSIARIPISIWFSLFLFSNLWFSLCPSCMWCIVIIAFVLNSHIQTYIPKAILCLHSFEWHSHMHRAAQEAHCLSIMMWVYVSMWSCGVGCGHVSFTFTVPVSIEWMCVSVSVSICMRHERRTKCIHCITIYIISRLLSVFRFTTYHRRHQQTRHSWMLKTGKCLPICGTPDCWTSSTCLSAFKFHYWIIIIFIIMFMTKAHIAEAQLSWCECVVADAIRNKRRVCL